MSRSVLVAPPQGNARTLVIPSLYTGTLPRVSPRTRRLAIFGDSLGAYANSQVQLPTTAGTLVVNSAGIATVTIPGSADSFCIPNNPVALSNPGDPTASALPQNGVIIKPLTRSANGSVITFDTRGWNGNLPPLSAIDWSNPYPAAASNNWWLTPLTFGSEGGCFLSIMPQLIPGIFKITSNMAVGGTASKWILGTVTNMLSCGYPFDLAFYSSGSNDAAPFVSGTWAQMKSAMDAAFVNLQTGVELLINAGKIVIVQLPPQNFYGQLINKGFLYYRKLIKNWVASDPVYSPYIYLLDTAAASIDGTNTNGGWAPNYSIDLIHPATQGWLKSGRQFKASGALAALVDPTTNNTPISVLEDTSTYSEPGNPYPNVMENGGMTGTAGTLSSATGTAPTNWTMAGVGCSPVCAGGVARPALPQDDSALWGEMATATVTFTGAGQQVAIISQFILPAVIPLDVFYEWGCTIYPLDTFSGLANIDAIISFFSTASMPACHANFTNPYLNNGFPGQQSDGFYEIRGKPIKFDSTTMAGLAAVQLTILLTSSGAGTISFGVAGAFLEVVPDPTMLP